MRGLGVTLTALIHAGAAASSMLVSARSRRSSILGHACAPWDSRGAFVSGHGLLSNAGALHRRRRQKITQQLCPTSAWTSEENRQQRRGAPTMLPSYHREANAAGVRRPRVRQYTYGTELFAKGSAAGPAPADTRQPPEESTSIDIVEGTRVRLRDTGRLGTVVGKKAGGWWIVDLLEGLGGVAAGKKSKRPPKDGNDKAAQGKGGVAKGATRRALTTVSVSGPISTRRVNIEPLGAAYALPQEGMDASKAPTSVAKKRSSTSTHDGSSTSVKRKGEKGKGSGARSSTASRRVKTATTRGKLAVVSSNNVQQQKVAMDIAEAYSGGEGDGSGTAAVDKGALTIRKMDEQGFPHADMKEWLLFSDLHVSGRSLAVCLEVLDRVNAEAMKRDACGIAFLGDFWHARGSLKVDLLVPVMERLATWTRPVVMIPGNHDQVTLGGGLHALTPLQFSFANPRQVLVLSEPTLFLNALWIPYRRDNAAMAGLLASKEARDARAILCHVDIKGAAMNDGFTSQAGIPRSAFPNDVPTFSGHFHKPHTVGDGFVRYVGSPYQETQILSISMFYGAADGSALHLSLLSHDRTSLSEAGQTKTLLVLSAKTWKEKEAIPLHVGRRFFRVKGDDQPLPALGEASPGDRVVWTVADVGSEEVKRRAEVLRKEMIEVEVREARRPFPPLAGIGGVLGRGQDFNGTVSSAEGGDITASASGLPDSATISPNALFQTYLERERDGGRNIPADVESLGFKFIEDLSQQMPLKETGQKDRHTALELQSIQLKNFGPFRDEVSYPLEDRGVVLLKGTNLDETGADSNGSGKTTLAMSALWALAGIFDARPVSDGRVADVVHEGSRAFPSLTLAPASTKHADADASRQGRRSTVAEATLTGTLNGKPLWVKRRKGARVNQLFLKHDGQDLTRQIAKETQVVLEEELGLSPHVLVRGIFQGQHHVNGLLESTDAQLKEDLALLVPMDAWQDLASRSRATARKSDEDAARFRERAATRREDLARLIEELERAREALSTVAAEGGEHHAAADTEAAFGTGSSGPAQIAASPRSETAGMASVRPGVAPGDTGGNDQTATGPSNGVASAKRAGSSKDGDEEGGPGSVSAAAIMGADRATAQARRVAKEAREDVESAEAALQSLRKEQEEVLERWTESKLGLLGEANAAGERVSFAIRDVDQAKQSLADAERTATEVSGEVAQLRETDLELWAGVLDHVNEEGGGDRPEPVASDLQAAEEVAASTHAALADARAALKHACEAVQAHAAMEVLGEGNCHACGQPVTGGIIYERGEILRVAQTVAGTEVKRLQREAALRGRVLTVAKSRADRWKRMLQGKRGEDEARERVGRKAAELRARVADLRRVESEASGADAEVTQQARREGVMRRDWAAKKKAAEWALKAYRDKQIFAQHELEETLAREAGLRLHSQAEQAERDRLSQAKHVARARVLEIERAIERVGEELADVEEKGRKASALKLTSNTLAEHFGVRGVQNFVFRDAVNQLEANVERYLHVLSDGALRLHLSVDADRVVKRASARAADGEFRDRSLSQLSGGQWRRASLALELAFAELARQRSRFSCNLLVLDEVLSQLDSSGRRRVADMLRHLAHGRAAAEDSDPAVVAQAMYTTILVILQDLPAEELQDSFDSVDEVVKDRDASSILVDGYA